MATPRSKNRQLPADSPLQVSEAVMTLEQREAAVAASVDAFVNLAFTDARALWTRVVLVASCVYVDKRPNPRDASKTLTLKKDDKERYEAAGMLTANGFIEKVKARAKDRGIEEKAVTVSQPTMSRYLRVYGAGVREGILPENLRPGADVESIVDALFERFEGNVSAKNEYTRLFESSKGGSGARQGVSEEEKTRRANDKENHEVVTLDVSAIEDADDLAAAEEKAVKVVARLETALAEATAKLEQIREAIADANAGAEADLITV